MVKVLMPKGSDTMTEGKVLKWVKKEGDQVSAGDAVVEIETDKVDMEVEAMGGGVLRKILVQSGNSVPVGELLALIAKPDEDISALLKERARRRPRRLRLTRLRIRLRSVRRRRPLRLSPPARDRHWPIHLLRRQLRGRR